MCNWLDQSLYPASICRSISDKQDETEEGNDRGMSIKHQTNPCIPQKSYPTIWFVALSLSTKQSLSGQLSAPGSGRADPTPLLPERGRYNRIRRKCCEQTPPSYSMLMLIQESTNAYRCSDPPDHASTIQCDVYAVGQ